MCFSCIEYIVSVTALPNADKMDWLPFLLMASLLAHSITIELCPHCIFENGLDTAYTHFQWIFGILVQGASRMRTKREEKKNKTTEKSYVKILLSDGNTQRSLIHKMKPINWFGIHPKHTHKPTRAHSRKKKIRNIEYLQKDIWLNFDWIQCSFPRQ